MELFPPARPAARYSSTIRTASLPMETLSAPERKYSGSHLQGGILPALPVGVVPYPPADGQGNKDVFRGPLQDLQHGQVFQGKIPKAGDVQKGDLVGPFLVIPPGQIHRPAQVPDLPFFPHVVLVALGHYQVALIVGAHIEAGDDPLGQSGPLRAISRQALRFARFKEILEQPQSGGAAFLRVKLGGHDVVLLHGADEPPAVIRYGQHDRFILGDHMEGMDEVKFFVPPDSPEKRRRLAHLHAVPADMGDRQIDGEASDRALKDPQAGNAGGLLTELKQGLETQANA